MSSSIVDQVTRSIRKHAWPSLRSHGFDDFASRTAWRRREWAIDVVMFQSAVGKYKTWVNLGNGHQAAPGTFSLNIGVTFDVARFVPWPTPYTLPQSARPQEFTCRYRDCLIATRPQPRFYPVDLWAIGEMNSEVDDVVREATRSVIETALPWFERNGDPELNFQLLRQRCDDHVRNQIDVIFRDEDELTGLAIALGRRDVAIEVFERIVAVPYTDRERKEFTRYWRRKLPFWHDEARRRLDILRSLNR